MPITPDTKNWTWVLERRCPDCGFEAAAVPRERVAQMTRDNAAASFADRFDTVSGEQWSRPGLRSDGSRFIVESFARYAVHDPVHHLVDVGV